MIYALNRKAKFDFSVKDTLVAGLVLSGPEVKALKQGNASLTGSYVSIRGNSAILINCHVGPYKYAKQEGYNPTQSRKLLLNKKELAQLAGLPGGTTVIPLEIFSGPRGLIKVKLGIARGRKSQDKREYLKERDAKREIRKNVNR